MMQKGGIIIAVAAVALTGLCACKTTESNYREAYEKVMAARAEQEDDIDSSYYGTVHRNVQVSYRELSDGRAVSVLARSVTATTDGGTVEDSIHRYNVAVGRFKQAFNAISLRNRIVADSICPAAFVVQTAEPYYYVIASSHRKIERAADALDSIPANIPVMKEPLPLILDATRRRH